MTNVIINDDEGDFVIKSVFLVGVKYHVLIPSAYDNVFVVMIMCLLL